MTDVILGGNVLSDNTPDGDPILLGGNRLTKQPSGGGGAGGGLRTNVVSLTATQLTNMLTASPVVIPALGANLAPVVQDWWLVKTGQITAPAGADPAADGLVLYLDPDGWFAPADPRGVAWTQLNIGSDAAQPNMLRPTTAVPPPGGLGWPLTSANTPVILGQSAHAGAPTVADGTVLLIGVSYLAIDVTTGAVVPA